MGDCTQFIEELEIDVDRLLTTNDPGSLTTNDSGPSSPYEGHQYSDYVLLGKDAKPLAVVEAKKTTKDSELGREQAKQYCHNIQNQFGGELPFCFFTNGRVPNSKRMAATRT